MEHLDIRVSKCEQPNTLGDHFDSADTRPRGNQSHGIRESIPIRPEPTNLTSEDIQGDFKQIKDSYNKNNLSSELRLFAEKTGIKRDDQPKWNVIVNCAKYSETILKILQHVDDDSLDREYCDQIATAAIAQQKYLQDEYAGLLVNSSFTPHTAKIFKQLQKNSSSFPASALNNLQTAASIAAAAVPQHSLRGRGSRNFRGRFRGRGYRRNSSDIYNNFTNDNFAPQRNDQD